MGDGAYDSADVYAAVEERVRFSCDRSSMSRAVASSQTSPTQCDGHIRNIAAGGRRGWQAASGSIDALWSRLRSAATSVSSATPFDLIPRRLDELKSRSAITFYTERTILGARNPSTLPDNERERVLHPKSVIPATRYLKLLKKYGFRQPKQRSLEKRGRIYRSGLVAKGTPQAHRFPRHPAEMIICRTLATYKGHPT